MKRFHCFLDFDGVVGDTWELNLRIAQELHPGVTFDLFAAHHEGNGYAQPRIPFTQETSASFFTLYNERLTVEHIRESLPYLYDLGEEHCLHIISSNRKEAIRRVIAEARACNLFGFVLGQEFHTSKVEKFRWLLNWLSIDAHETPFVTDTSGDVHEANEVGLPTIAVTFGYHSRKQLWQACPVPYIADTWEDVVSRVYDMRASTPLPAV